MNIADLPDTHPLKKALADARSLLAQVGGKEGARVRTALDLAARSLATSAGGMSHGTEEELLALSACVRSLDDVVRLSTHSILPNAHALAGRK